MKTTVSQLLRFSLVGTIGFVVDASVLHIAVKAYGADPYLGRVISYLTAATATWKLNRRFTFASSATYGLHREWAHYVAVNAIGGGINYLVYALCLLSLRIVKEYLIIGVAAGSLVGLAFNFTISKLWVFRRH